MYICGGFNVYPAEVEQALARLDGVVESAVIGIPDERLGEVGKAFVVRRARTRLDADEVIALRRERLANFKVPREVEFVDDLPRNAVRQGPEERAEEQAHDRRDSRHLRGRRRGSPWRGSR